MNRQKVLTALTAVLISGSAFAAAPMWGTRVHSHLIDIAFPKEDKLCRANMKLGSIAADAAEYQDTKYSYMHAMRTPEQTPEEAEDLMWKFIRDKYKEIRKEKAKYRREPWQTAVWLKACLYRGIALHPVMDMTSPEHAGFKVWHDDDYSGYLRHGDFREALIEKTGFSFGFPHSHEDMEALKSMPDVKALTIRLMRQVDGALLKKDDAELRYQLEKP